MRLIHAKTLELRLFPDPVPVHYAILSHTWTDDEVTFEDMKDIASARSKGGFSKIEAICRLALLNDFEFAWVDTCCIDKSSSAELSEAINPMFDWYKNADICFAFLFDLTSGSEDFHRCRWFTRGWTPQELIAPTQLHFLDENWEFKGTKFAIAEQIELITGVDTIVLNDSTMLSEISLAKRMSWAATRQTTRIEDKAYCLMGIFDVNMPMIYGEGLKSFARLQEEVLKRTTDLSLFAWHDWTDSREYCGILAESPEAFSDCREISSDNNQFFFRDEISITNKGVKINMALKPVGNQEFIMNLYCYQKTPEGYV